MGSGLLVESAAGFVVAPSWQQLVPSQVSSFFHRKATTTRRHDPSRVVAKNAPTSSIDPSPHHQGSLQPCRHFLLVPSQVITGTSSSATRLHASVTADIDPASSPSNASDSSSPAAGVVIMKKKAKSRRKPRRRPRNNDNKSPTDAAQLVNGNILPRLLSSNPSFGSAGDDSESNTDSENESAERPGLSSTVSPTTNTVALPREGNLPDVYWRSLPMEHLRLHPRFVPLPECSSIRQLELLEDVRQFRQDSWQWDALHVGRCTTSQAVAALGFLENMAGEFLHIPYSWRRGGRGAYQRLRQPSPLRTIDDMNRVLVAPPPPSSVSDATTSSTQSTKPPTVWIPGAEQLSNITGSRSEQAFVARYNHRLSTKEMDRRKKLARQFSTHDSSSSLRLTWGSVQEATALLTALNYFAEKDPAFVMKEVGMCGAGLAMNESSSLLVGASPDAVLCHGDGTIEALEVKNHCPFVTPFHKKGKPRSSKRFRIGDRHLAEAGIFAQYIPQLMLEMLCLGDACRSAVMVRQSATMGALLLRVRRDDEWIHEMLHFLGRFQDEFVDAGQVPPPNFFFLGEDPLEVKRYRRFLNKTLEVRNHGLEVIAHIPPESIQRAQNADAPLFLD